MPGKIIGYLPNGLPIYLIAGGDDTTRLLQIVEALDPTKRQKEEQPPTDEELQEARVGLLEALRGAAEGDRPDLEAARAIRSAIDTIDAEHKTREEARAEASAEAKKLLDGVVPAPVGDPPPDPAPEGTDDDPEADPAPEPDVERERVPVTASTSLADAITRSSRRRTERATPEVETSDVIVSSAGPAQGRHIGPNATLNDVAELFNQYSGHVKRGSAVLLHMENVYPESRSLGLSSAENTRIIDSVTSPRAIVAAGGICDPLPADFNHPICGDRGRPIRDALVGFRADRGGIRFSPSATVADLEPAITVWTHETDTTPGSETKDCPRVNCEEELTARVDAVVACLTVGNFQARFNPEFWRSRLDLLMVAHDRIAEQTLYNTIVGGSTAVTYAGGSGTVVDVLQAIDKATAGGRSRHRLLGRQFRAIMPAWLQDALRAHLANQAPAGSVDLFGVAQAQLNQFFATRGVTPVWSPDVDVFGAQAAGALLDFPGGDVDVVLYPEGSWLFLDGGTLDMGTNITDSSLNAVNDRQAFIETFEQAVFRGCESLVIDVPVDEACICLAAAGS